MNGCPAQNGPGTRRSERVRRAEGRLPPAAALLPLLLELLPLAEAHRRALVGAAAGRPGRAPPTLARAIVLAGPVGALAPVATRRPAAPIGRSAEAARAAIDAIGTVRAVGSVRAFGTAALAPGRGTLPLVPVVPAPGRAIRPARSASVGRPAPGVRAARRPEPFVAAPLAGPVARAVLPPARPAAEAGTAAAETGAASRRLRSVTIARSVAVRRRIATRSTLVAPWPVVPARGSVVPGSVILAGRPVVPGAVVAARARVAVGPLVPVTAVRILVGDGRATRRPVVVRAESRPIVRVPWPAPVGRAADRRAIPARSVRPALLGDGRACSPLGTVAVRAARGAVRQRQALILAGGQRQRGGGQVDRVVVLQ